MKVTITQINNSFKQFASKHKMLKSYLDIPIDENKASDYTYPMMLVDWTKPVNLTLGSGEITCDVYILDKITRDFTKLTNILSDAFQVCDDFHTIFINNEQKYGFVCDDNIALEVIAFDYEDIICGYKMSINLTVVDNLRENEIPM